MRSLLICVVLFLAPQFASQAAADDNFTLAATPVESVEDGPVAVKLVLSYKGNAPIQLNTPDAWGEHAVEVTAPKTWHVRKSSGFLASIVAGLDTVQPGEMFTVIVYLHHSYDRIPPGKASISLTWPVGRYVGAGKSEKWVTIASPTTSLELDIGKATSETLGKVKKRLDALFHDGNIGGEDLVYLAATLRNLKHPDFAPVAFKLLGKPWSNEVGYSVHGYVYNWSRLGRIPTPWSCRSLSISLS